MCEDDREAQRTSTRRVTLNWLDVQLVSQYVYIIYIYIIYNDNDYTTRMYVCIAVFTVSFFA